MVLYQQAIAIDSLQEAIQGRLTAITNEEAAKVKGTHNILYSETRFFPALSQSFKGLLTINQTDEVTLPEFIVRATSCSEQDKQRRLVKLHCKPRTIIFEDEKEYQASIEQKKRIANSLLEVITDLLPFAKTVESINPKTISSNDLPINELLEHAYDVVVVS